MTFRLENEMTKVIIFQEAYPVFGSPSIGARI